MINKKHRNVSKLLNYIEDLLILASTVTGYVSIYILAFLVDILIGITSSAIQTEISIIIPGIRGISH